MLPDGRIRVAMGPVVVAPEAVRDRDRRRHGLLRRAPVDVGNPHAVSFVDDLAAVWLRTAPEYPTDAFPDGVNAEFVQRLGERHLAMRVFERGSGETRSCGTGTVAAAAAAHAARTRPMTAPALAEPATVPGRRARRDG